LGAASSRAASGFTFINNRWRWPLGNAHVGLQLRGELPGLRQGSFFAGSALSDQQVTEMLISWDDVNRTEKTGLHFVARLGLDVFVTAGAIARWKADPECHHRVVHIPTTLGKMYGLGPCEPLQEN
jgi:hypothetical protein